MRKVLDSRLWIRLGLENKEGFNRSFMDDLSNKSHLGKQLLLYDQIIIPTKDFGIVLILINWFGFDMVLRLIKEGTISFKWQDLHEAYGGGGGGLMRAAVGKPDGGWENWGQIARWEKPSMSAEAQIENNDFNQLSSDQKKKLIKTVLDNTTEIDTSKSNLDIIKETANDISKNPSLNHFLFQFEKTRDPINLNKLSGIQPGQLRVVNGFQMKDGIDLVLRIAEKNREIDLASTIDNCDLFTSDGTLGLMKKKLSRSGISNTQVKGFADLLTLEKIPDIGPIIENDQLKLQELIEIRESENCENFRKWMHEKNATNPLEIQQAYVKAIGEKRSSKLGIKSIRLAITTAAGFVPVLGSLVDAADTYFVDKLIDGFSPKIFLEDLRSLPIEDE